MGKFCKACGTQLNADAKFCRACGAQTKTIQQSVEKEDQKARTDTATAAFSTAQMAAHYYGNLAAAPCTPGEISFTHAPAIADGTDFTVGPIKCLMQGIVALAKGFGGVFRNKRKWIPAVIMAMLWILLTVLPALGINGGWVSGLSFLTYAGGGTGGGVAGMLGGIAGKGVFAYFVTALVLPLTGDRPFSGVIVGFRRMLPALAVKTSAQVAPLMAGVGGALVAYNMMTGDAPLQNSMAGVAAYLLSLRALSAKAGFLHRFAAALTAMPRREKPVDNQAVTRLLSGWASGFALAIPLSFIKINFLCYIVGAVALTVALVLKLVSFRKKEAAA